ncbi:MAG: hybrid sensor histidine kinase/response regulator [Pseudomonadota bacterium]
MNIQPLLDHARSVLLPVGMAGLSPRSQAELLDMSYSRLRFSVYMMPLIALPLVAYFGWSFEALPLALWGLAYVVAALLTRWYVRRYENAQKTMAPQALTARWLGRVQSLAWLHGLGLGMSVVVAMPVATLEFMMMQYLVIAHIVSTNASHQTPTIGIFLRFFATSWHLILLAAFWGFPDLWQTVIPLGLIYSLVIYRHALKSHRYAIEQVQVKERSEQLAEQFRAAKERAESALQEKNLFLTTASHDLRQPLHAMSMLVEAMEHRNTDATVKPLLVDLKSSMRSMNQMFNALLDLSRLEAGTLPMRASTLDLSALLLGIGTMFREQAHQRGLSLRVHLPRGEARVCADPMLLRQAVGNLVHNALRYTPEGGILVGLRRRSGGWQVEVWDTGVGIASQDSDHIFSPYYRNQDAWRIDSAGHGLGLAVAARCARMLQAGLDFQSRPGKGSRFWLRLPPQGLAPMQQLESEAGNSQQSAPLRRLTGTCLVVDDDPQVIAAWQALLQVWGINARFATNGGEAFQHIEEGFMPASIFCDQRLRSGESGLQILRALLERCPDASGAMVSGELHSADLLAAESEGYLILRKPLEVEHLHALLSTWLNPAR